MRIIPTLGHVRETGVHPFQSAVPASFRLDLHYVPNFDDLTIVYLPGCVLLPAAHHLLDNVGGALPGRLLVIPSPPHHPVTHPS